MAATDLHFFGDSGIFPNCAAVYAVVYQPSIFNKTLLASKSRISKEDVTIPRHDLVLTNMGSNLVSNANIISWVDI